MYKKISELKDQQLRITQNYVDDLEKFVQFAKENYDEGLTLSDIINHHLHEMDRSAKYNKTEAKKVDINLTLTASAYDTLDFLAKENDVHMDFVVEKIAETIVSDKKFRKWEKDNDKKVEPEASEAAVH